MRKTGTIDRLEYRTHRASSPRTRSETENRGRGGAAMAKLKKTKSHAGGKGRDSNCMGNTPGSPANDKPADAPSNVFPVRRTVAPT